MGHLNVKDGVIAVPLDLRSSDGQIGEDANDDCVGLGGVQGPWVDSSREIASDNIVGDRQI